MHVAAVTAVAYVAQIELRAEPREGFGISPRHHNLWTIWVWPSLANSALTTRMRANAGDGIEIENRVGNTFVHVHKNADRAMVVIWHFKAESSRMQDGGLRQCVEAA